MAAAFGLEPPGTPLPGREPYPSMKTNAVLERLAFLAEAVQALVADADAKATAKTTTKQEKRAA